MKLDTLSTGDPVYLYENTLIIQFVQPRKVLSTSQFHGGYHEALTAVFNHHSDFTRASNALPMTAYKDYMRWVAEQAELDPDRVTGMGTAALMENTAVHKESYQNLTVTALVTGGIEVNGGRVGDPAGYFQPGEKTGLHPPGTINIILVIDADLPAGTLARALVTCTEAKTAALQELMAGSNYSHGLATGSGTDQTIVIANPASELYLESAGKHAKLGELIGCVVKKSVKEALRRQTGLSPAMQHSVLRRMKRFGVTAETLWRDYQREREDTLTHDDFLACLHLVEQDSRLVTYTSLYVHLLDQFIWELLSGEEVMEAGNQLEALAAVKFGTSPVPLTEPKLENFIQSWARLILHIMHHHRFILQGDREGNKEEKME